MGGINPILQLLLSAWRMDPYDPCAITSGSTSGSFPYQGKEVEFSLEFRQLGNNIEVIGTVGGEHVGVKVVEPHRCAVAITLPKVPGSDVVEKIELVFDFSSDDQLHTAWRRVENLFGYAK